MIARFSNGLQLMTDAVSVSLPQFVVAGVTFLSSFAMMIYLDWLLTLTLVVVAPMVSIAVSKFQRLISTSTLRTQESVADLSANLTEILAGQRVVKAFGGEEYEIRRFRRANEDFFGAYMKLTQFIQTQPLVVSTIMVLAVVVIMWLSVREVLVGRLTTEHIFNYWLLLVNLANPLNRLAAGPLNIQFLLRPPLQHRQRFVAGDTENPRRDRRSSRRQGADGAERCHRLRTRYVFI